MTVPAALAPYVGWMAAYDTDVGMPAIHRGLPGTDLTFVLPVDEPLDVAWADGSHRRRAWSSVAGLHPACAMIRHTGRQRGVMLGLRLAGAPAFWGVPAASLAGELLDLDDVAPALRTLPERLAEARPERWSALVEGALLDVLAGHEPLPPRPEVGWALRDLARGMPVHRVAEDVGYSRRRLDQLVRAGTGLAPKQFQRIARFDRSRRYVGRVPLAEVARRCGYADQAHLTHEWHDLAGCTPSTWLREEFPFLQDRRREKRAV